MLILPDKSIAVWKSFWEENKLLIYKYVVKQIKVAVEEGKNRAYLFGFENDNTKVWIDRKGYAESLDKALNYFVELEEFELATKTQKVINKFHIDEVIRQSNDIEE